jgi:hypothetical protein
VTERNEMTDDEIGKQMMDDELGPARMVVETPGADELVARCINYLASGGLFNPECMDPRTVRDLVIACRATIAAQEKEIAKLRADAARYRWLRDQIESLYYIIPNAIGSWGMVDLADMPQFGELDAAIDAQLKEGP